MVLLRDGAPMSDQKIKSALGKARLGLIPLRLLCGVARVFAYGAKRYAPGNFHNATLDDGAGERYVSGAMRHLSAMQCDNGLHTPESLAALDEESGLPHIDHAICGLVMLRSIMVKCGALPADPGEGLEPPRAPSVAEITAIGQPVLACGKTLEEIVREFDRHTNTSPGPGLPIPAPFHDPLAPTVVHSSPWVGDCACQECVHYRTNTTGPLPADPRVPSTDFADKENRYDY